jgi:hypothetical protein
MAKCLVTQDFCLFDQQLQSHTDSALEQLRVVISSLFGTEDFIRSEILWTCLVDPTQDAVIIKAIDEDLGTLFVSPGTEEENHLPLVIDVKLNVLEHLTAQIRRLSSLEREGKSDASRLAGKRKLLIIRPRFVQCLRLCSYLSLRLPRLRQGLSERGTNKVGYFYMARSRASLTILITYFLIL